MTRALTLPVVLGALLGAAGGWLWWTWWSPAPDGKIFDTPAGPTWYPSPFDQGITSDFGGTATYVVVAFGLAALLGLVGGWVARHHAVPGVLAVLVGTGLAAAAMTWVGESFSAPDPATLVASHQVGDVLPGHLHVAGWTPYLAWPVGAMLAYLVLMVSFPVPSSGDGRVSDAGARPGQPSAAPAPPG
ncbi:hypothetical protein [Nocardioides humi]|uniref:DUF2567 domain-containing protein n=1 Tax=Nocardioides humi TaxID=449461 RepID=A0ABN2AQA3_9ACTN|nr:hypothetical protein [Nocardioides humi]